MSKWIRYTEHPLNPLLMDRQRWEAGPAFEKHRWCLVPRHGRVPVPLFEYHSPGEGYPAYAVAENRYSNELLQSEISKRVDVRDFLLKPIQFLSLFPDKGSNEAYRDQGSRELFDAWAASMAPYLAVACHPRLISNSQSRVFNQLKPLLTPGLFTYRSDHLYLQQFRSADLKELVPILFDLDNLTNFFLYPTNEVLHISSVQPYTQQFERWVGLSSFTDFDEFRNLVLDLGWMITTHSNVQSTRPICVYADPGALPDGLGQPGSHSNMEWTETTDLFKTAADYEAKFPSARDKPSLSSEHLLPQPGMVSKISLVNSPVAHLDELAELPGIVDLEIDRNYIWNLPGALSRLSQLESLAISNITVTSFEFLSALRQLVRLKLVNIHHLEVLHLPWTPELKALHIEQGGVHAVSFQQPPGKLAMLDLTGSNISDLRFIEQCSTLSRVVLDGSKVNDFGPLQKLPQLAELSAGYMAEANWQSATELVELTTLSVSSNDLEDIDWCSRLPKLERLDLSNNLVRDLGALNSLPNLNHLNLNNNRIVSLEGITRLAKLEELHLGENNILGYTSLRKIAANHLKKLTLSYSGFNNLEHIAHFNKITYLDISGTLVKEIGLLNQFAMLEELHVGYCEFDFRVMESIHFPGLVSLNVNGNTLDDLLFLRNFKQIRKLSLSSCTIKNTDGIQLLLELAELDIRDATLPDLSFLMKLESLSRLVVDPSVLSPEILHELKEKRNVEIKERPLSTGANMQGWF